MVTNDEGVVHQFFLTNAWGEELHTYNNTNTSSFNSEYRFNDDGVRSTASIERCARSAELDEETGLAYYGARYYDNKISMWLSVDRLAAKYPHSSPYAFSGNDPVTFVDPNGDSLMISWRSGCWLLGNRETHTVMYDGGSLFNTDGSAYTGKVNGFLGDVTDALNTISGSDEGFKMIADLENSDNRFTIVKGESEFRESSVIGAHWNAYSEDVQSGLITHGRDGSGGSGGVIQWDPSGRRRPLVGGSGVNASMDLAHEMSHAADANMGLLDSRMHGVAPQSTRSEWQAVYRENIIRGQLSLPLRISHRSSYDPNTRAVGPLQPYMLSNGTSGSAVRPTWNNWKLR